ncbi:MAG TPA: Clp protease N-terminal domain-containing protein, partial [Hyphomicrobiaceae bacterium]|nr:Clp protease N-terminal domain-containing protein [Hyphomicrobiaceae bacterium]
MSRCACCGQPLPSSSHRRAEFSVDDDVLAVCNGAFGIAAAAGSGYVDVDHLILALSRYDDGRGLLARAGFDLERAAAAVEVSARVSGDAERRSCETPKPQASDRFQDVLRHATARARSRGSAFAAVGDVVAALHTFGVSRGR